MTLQERNDKGQYLSESEKVLLALQHPAVFLESITELDGAPTVLEPYQIRFLNDMSPFRWVSKSRQIGFSTILAGEVTVKAITNTGYKANIISINREEASDKIDIARNFYHSLPDGLADIGLKPPLWNDSAHEIAFHRPPDTSQIISQPASAAVRGGKKDIYFDEFAHIRDARKLYLAAIPAITRGDGRISIISTPLGQSGMFYDIGTDEMNYPEYSRHTVPWWECSIMVKPGMMEEALAMAAGMDTEARLKKYGTDKLISIFNSFGGDFIGFQTEYEAVFVDESTAYYPWSLIVDCVDDDKVPLWRDLPPNWEPDGHVSIGVDLAKTRDETVFTVVEFVTVGTEIQPFVRYVRTSQDDYADQLDELLSLAKRSKASRVSIDQTGVGAFFVEQAKRRANEVPGCVIEGIVFTNAKKERWATTFKGDLQLRKIHLPRKPELLRQIHGISRSKTEANFFKFSGKPHDDYFWSLMLGLYGEGRVPARISVLG